MIEGMKIRPLTSGMMIASGTAFANVALPKGMDMSLQVDAIYLQLLIYDGPVPDGESVGMEALEDDGGDLPDPIPLPDPLPANAFAYIRPGKWFKSIGSVGSSRRRVHFFQFQ